MAVVSDANNTRYNVTIPTGNGDAVLHQKETTNVIQSLQVNTSSCVRCVLLCEY